MNPLEFVLQPHPGIASLPGIKINGSLVRQDNRFSIGFRLSGSLSEIEIPGPSASPNRRIGLWEATCFEFFMALQQSPRYWEFNLSPSGAWNVFRFETYRQQELEEERAFPALPFRVSTDAVNNLSLDLQFDLGSIIQPDQALEVAISSVIRTKEGQETLWALTHPGPTADFHHRDGFIIRI
jgi:hypothetical protein